MTHTARTRKPVPRVAYGVAEVAEMLGVSPSFIRLEISRGRIATMRAGRRLLVTKASFDEYVAARS